jgi:hypothetical protein
MPPRDAADEDGDGAESNANENGALMNCGPTRLRTKA